LVFAFAFALALALAFAFLVVIPSEMRNLLPPVLPSIGTISPLPMPDTLTHWNTLPPAAAAAAILPCNGSPTWAAQLAALRPFDTPFALTCTADILWRALPPADQQQAFDSHPRIGEHHAKAATAASLALSATEQAAAQLTPTTQQQLAAANALYEQTFNRIFIVCATGKSAEEMLSILRSRLSNDPTTELREAAEQQRQITQIRLRKWLHPG
jgi:2-oxo-4-hydroxy-4-carboxy-5-ureidoimidazoline decarboxylase